MATEKEIQEAKEEFMKKVDDLAKDLPEFVNKCAASLLDAGVLDFEEYSKKLDWHLPKQVMCAIGKEIQREYTGPLRTPTDVRRHNRAIKRIYQNIAPR